MRMVVTGGAGFIGSNLAIALEGLGHEVVVLDNFLSGDRRNLRQFMGDWLLVDVAAGLPDLGKVDVVFHHGDITDPRFEPQDTIYRRNLAGFNQVLNFAKKQNARLIYASTAGLYGNGPTPMQEDQPKEVVTEYGRSKLKMDRLAATQSSELPIIGLRYFNVFGPREAAKGRPASMVYHLANQIRDGKHPRLFYSGEQKRDFIYVKDVVEANLCALKAESGVYNVGTGIATSFNELVQALNEVLNTNYPIDYFKMPYDPKTYQANTQADLTQAKTKLGFESKWPLKKAIQDYLTASGDAQ